LFVCLFVCLVSRTLCLGVGHSFLAHGQIFLLSGICGLYVVDALPDERAGEYIGTLGWVEGPHTICMEALPLTPVEGGSSVSSGAEPTLFRNGGSDDAKLITEQQYL
jgi:hypothetical protein